MIVESQNLSSDWRRCRCSLGEERAVIVRSTVPPGVTDLKIIPLIRLVQRDISGAPVVPAKPSAALPSKDHISTNGNRVADKPSRGVWEQGHRAELKCLRCVGPVGGGRLEGP